MKLTLTGHIYATKYSWSDELRFSFDQGDRTSWDKDAVPVQPHEITVEIPDNFDARPGLVANLEREKAELQAKFQARITEINGQIQSLLALPMETAS